MTSFNNHKIMTDDEVDEIVLELTDMLEDSHDQLEEDIRDIISSGNYDNRDADDFFQVALDVFAFAIIQGETDRVDVMGDDRSFAKVLKQAYQFAVAVFAVTDRSLSDELSDREYDDFAKLVDTHAKILDDLRGNRGRGHGGRGRGRDSHERGRSRGRGTSTRGGRGRGRDRDVREERTDRTGRRSSRTTSRGVSGVKTSYRAGARPSPRREEPEEHEEKAAPRKLVDVAYVTQPKIVLAEKSTISPNFEPATARSWAIDPTKQGVYHVAVNNEPGVIETVLEYSGDNMEDYKEHEIKRSVISTDKDGGIVIPQVDFRKVPDLGTAEAEEWARKTEITTAAPFSFCSTTFGINTIGMENELVTNQAYTIARGDQYRPASVPQCVNDLMEGVDKYSTFESWHNLMTMIQDRLSDMNRRDTHLAAGFLTFLEDNLKFMFNNLLAIILPRNATLDSFIKYFHEGIAYLKEPAQADEYAAWMEMEREYIRHNFSMLSEDVQDELTENGTLYPKMVSTEEVRYCWFKTNMIVVRASGDLLADQLKISNDKYISQIEFKYTPEFYSACERLVAYRNKNLKMSTIIMFDSIGNQLMVLASNVDGGIIKIRKL